MEEESKQEEFVLYNPPGLNSVKFQIQLEDQLPNQTISNEERTHGEYELIDPNFEKPQIDIVDEELERIEFESQGKTTNIGSMVVPPI